MPKVYDMLQGLCFWCRRTLGSAQQISGSFLLSTRCFLSYQVAEAPSSRYTSDEVFRNLVTERLEAKAMAVQQMHLLDLLLISMIFWNFVAF